MRYLFIFFLCATSFSAVTDFHLKMKDGFEYQVSAPLQNSESKQPFAKLSPANQALFLEKRILLLRTIASTLHGMKTPLGVWRKIIRPRLDWLYGKSKPLDNQKMTYKETGHQTVTEILKELDEQLWSKPEAVSRANEYGVALEIGVSGGAKAGKRGVYGIAGLGILASVDPLEKVVSLELFGDLESAKRAIPFYAGAGVFSTLMGSALSTDWSKPLKKEEGCGFCTLGLVGLLSDRFLGLGVSKEIGVGFPGTVLMESSLSRRPILKVGASPRWKGFVRLKTPLSCQSALKKVLGE